jgi:hypothetical protein
MNVGREDDDSRETETIAQIMGRNAVRSMIGKDEMMIGWTQECFMPKMLPED